MKIASVVLTHAHPKMTKDTVESIKAFTGSQVMVLVDEVGWDQFKNFPNAEKGLYHAHKRSPYRNYALGLKKLYAKYPDADWYVYTEYDCVFVSDKFKDDLKEAEERNAWVVGVDLRRFPFEFNKLYDIVGVSPPKYSYYFLGCCHFHHKDFIKKLSGLNFFDRFLNATENFEKGKFPGYNRYAFEEELWPTLAVSLGGSLYELSCWKYGEYQEHQHTRTNDPHCYYAGRDHDTWRGRFKRYPIRNSPDIQQQEIFPEASIVHPLKEDGVCRAELEVRRRVALKRKHLFL